MKQWLLPNGKILRIGKFIPYKGIMYHDIKHNISKQFPEYADKILDFAPRQIIGSEKDFTILLKNGDIVYAKYQEIYAFDLT